MDGVEWEALIRRYIDTYDLPEHSGVRLVLSYILEEAGCLKEEEVIQLHG